MNRDYPIRIRYLNEDEAQELIGFGFHVERIVYNLYLITFREVL